MKRAKEQLSRADLLQALQTENSQIAAQIAQQLGLSLRYPAQDKIEGSNDLSVEFRFEGLQSEFSISGEKSRPAKGFWYLHKREQNEPLTLGKERLLSQQKEVVWRNKPIQKPRHLLLASPQEIVSRLQPYFIEQRQGKNIEVAKVVKQISQGEPIKKLARQNKKYTTSHIHIIDDRQSYLMPYWLDNEAVSYCLQAYYKDTRHSRSILIEGEQTPRQVTAFGLDKWQIPASQSTVVILSDLGTLASSNTPQVDIWLKLGRELQHQQCKVVVLLPCDKNQCDPRFKSLFYLESWQGSTEKSEGKTELAQQVETLLTLLAPGIRIEPSLLRQMRLAILANTEQAQNGQFSIAIESLLWQHAAIQERHSVAATWGAAKRKQYLAAFEQLTINEQTMALGVMRAWRGGTLSQQVWFEEVSSLSSAVQQLDCIQEDVEDAADYFQQLSMQSLQNKGLDIPQERLSWFKRLENRMPGNSFEQSGDLQRISRFIHKDELHSQARNIDPRNLPSSDEEEKQGVLIQQGERLYLLPYTIKQGVPIAYIDGFNSPLALIRLRSKQVQVKVNNKNYGSLVFGGKQAMQLPVEGGFTVISDMEVLHFSLLSILSPPPLQITKNIARDSYGLYTDLIINNITQRFRYIQPGHFLMGSPEDEPEREIWSAKETQPPVTLTKGFWLADTTVTQALYQAVMGENLSDFKEDINNPVEQVSWDNAQQFIAKLNSMVPALDAQLPTEAQWEYACRAGTTTPFSFGDNITPEQVNYNGTNPYAEGKKGLYRKKTVTVKTFPANPWGLYEMHGNIWEWCADHFQTDLGKQSVIDPVGTGGALRVLRGGSWRSFGGGVRSAMRDRDSPGSRSDFIGLRLSLGLDLQTGQAERPDSQLVTSRRDGAMTPDGGQAAEDDKSAFATLKNFIKRD